MKKVLFVCSGGMSSAIVEKALDKEAKSSEIELYTSAVGSGEAEEVIKNNDWNVILVAPQVKHRFKIFEKAAEENEIPIFLIKPQDYSPLGGKNILHLVNHVK